jgi:hypothetical protein
MRGDYRLNCRSSTFFLQIFLSRQSEAPKLTRRAYFLADLCRALNVVTQSKSECALTIAAAIPVPALRKQQAARFGTPLVVLQCRDRRQDLQSVWRTGVALRVLELRSRHCEHALMLVGRGTFRASAPRMGNLILGCEFDWRRVGGLPPGSREVVRDLPRIPGHSDAVCRNLRGAIFSRQVCASVDSLFRSTIEAITLLSAAVSLIVGVV